MTLSAALWWKGGKDGEGGKGSKGSKGGKGGAFFIASWLVVLINSTPLLAFVSPRSTHDWCFWFQE